MKDPVAGLTEMRRVTRRNGVVAACVWDHAGDHGPLSLFWATARQLDPGVEDESDLPGVRQGHLGELFREAGLHQVEETALPVEVEHPTFEDWWEPYTLGVGPAGSYVASLGPERQVELRRALQERIPAGRFVLTAKAWAARGAS
jgi:hypothetical protein